MQLFTLKDIEALSGVAGAAINQWRKKFPQLFPISKNEKPECFSREEVMRILSFCLLQQCKDGKENFITMAPDQLLREVNCIDVSDTNHSINILKVLLPVLQFNAIDVQNILSEIAAKTSFETSITKVVYPLLVRLKKLKATGDSANPYAAFFQKLIEAKLMAVINLLPEPKFINKGVVIFSPLQNVPTVAYFFLHFLVRKAGFTVIDLGPNVSFKMLQPVRETKTIFYVLVYLPSPLYTLMPNDYFEMLVQLFPNKKIVACGAGAALLQRNFLNVSVLKTDDEIYRFIEKMR